MIKDNNNLIYLFKKEQNNIISNRTKAALAELKAQGVKLGNPQNLTEESRQRSIEVRTAKAKKDNAIVVEVINQMRSEKMSYRKIAAFFNDSGVRTSRGGNFKPATIKVLENRYCK